MEDTVITIDVEWAADAVVAVRVDRVGVWVGRLAVGHERADLEGAEAGQRTKASLNGRQGLCIDMRRHREVAVGGDPPIIGQGDLQPIGA